MSVVLRATGDGLRVWQYLLLRLRDWQAAGVWARLERQLLQRLSDADAFDWSRAAVDSLSIPAKRGAKRPGRIQRIARNRARSAMWWSMPTACRSPRS
jgi:hypothetical protein